MSKDNDEHAPGKAWLMGAVGWLVPGLGHLLQGRWGRAALLGGAVWTCFLAGLWMGGHLFIVNGAGAAIQIWWQLRDYQPLFAALLQVPPMIANLGSGVLYGICWFFGVGFADDPVHAARATYEYGNTFLLIAGLLNYLVMLDAFDVSAGRKS